MRTVVLIQGGGIGLDQEISVRRILEAARVPVAFRVFTAGRAALEQGLVAIPDEALNAIRETGIALKTKLLQPKGAGTPTAHGPDVPTNYNVEFRKKLGLFASVRPILNLAGLPSRFSGVNFLLVREITEDLYTASEHEVVPGVVQSFKIVTEVACMRFFRYAFELARKQQRKSIHCIHKANILKLADGLYLDCFRRVAKDFPEITPKELIVDNACMQMVSKPTQFEVMAAGNLYGDLLSDLGAGLVGGISATAAVNHGPNIPVYEAVYGTGYETVPPDRANPLPLLLPAVEMLRGFGLVNEGQRIIDAIGSVLTEGSIKPCDLGGTAGTAAFTTAVINAL